MCNKCNGGCNSCQCTCNTPCITPDCACKVFITTDCVTLTEDLPCSNILKGQTETEVLKQLDAYICELFGTVQNFLQLINIGGGIEVYKGVNNLGKKEIRTLIDSNLINIVQGTDNITISVDEVALNNFIEANQKTYSITNIGTGAEVYKNSTIVGDNTTFNLKKIKSSSGDLNIINGIDDIDINLQVDQDNFVRRLKIFDTDLPNNYTKQDICDYILSLPEISRTILETDSKWNIVIEEGAS